MSYLEIQGRVEIVVLCRGERERGGVPGLRANNHNDSGKFETVNRRFRSFRVQSLLSRLDKSVDITSASLRCRRKYSVTHKRHSHVLGVPKPKPNCFNLQEFGFVSSKSINHSPLASAIGLAAAHVDPKHNSKAHPSFNMVANVHVLFFYKFQMQYGPQIGFVSDYAHYD